VGGQGLKPPSWRRAIIFAAVLAVAYFVMIQYLWVPKDADGNRTSTVWGSLIIAVIGFVVFAFIVYFTDKFTYQRRLRKLKGGSGQQFGK
jgi:Na+/H+-translocating membrane pyrophosphatase